MHIVAACVWARGPAIRANDSVSPADAGISPDASRPSLPADVLAELLALDPAAVNRQAGVAAVRKLAAATRRPDIDRAKARLAAHQLGRFARDRRRRAEGSRAC